MDFEQDNNLSQPRPPEQPPTPPPGTIPPIPTLPAAGPVRQPEPKKRSGWRVFWGIILALSIFGNMVLFLMLVGAIVALAVGQDKILTEETIREGPRSIKIAVVRLEGIIDDEQAKGIYTQLKRAREDRRVKGIILRVNSPGGTISGSDRIYNEIRNKTDKPVVAFMEGVAASGGYYASVACEKIVAEPTTITGSIGVIGAYLVLEDLLKEKLGIQPIVVKSGPKKDWPSYFRDPNEAEIEYLQEKLIRPAYKRFLKVIEEGRESVLTAGEIKELADGSIYGAQEALEEKLIDTIGYLDEAIEEVKSLAGIKDAQVVEYYEPFSFAEFMGSQSSGLLKIDKATLYELSRPQALYLWTVNK